MLCYEVSKTSVNVRNVAKEFFTIMLPTMTDSIQYKRGAGGAPASVVREASVQLLSRTFFTAIVKNLKVCYGHRGYGWPVVMWDWLVKSLLAGTMRCLAAGIVLREVIQRIARWYCRDLHGTSVVMADNFRRVSMPLVQTNIFLQIPLCSRSTNVNEAYLKEVLLITLDNALLVNPNNAFWLRARGDFELGT